MNHREYAELEYSLSIKLGLSREAAGTILLEHFKSGIPLLVFSEHLREARKTYSGITDWLGGIPIDEEDALIRPAIFGAYRDNEKRI